MIREPVFNPTVFICPNGSWIGTDFNRGPDQWFYVSNLEVQDGILHADEHVLPATWGYG